MTMPSTPINSARLYALCLRLRPVQQGTLKTVRQASPTSVDRMAAMEQLRIDF